MLIYWGEVELAQVPSFIIGGSVSITFLHTMVKPSRSSPRNKAPQRKDCFAFPDFWVCVESAGSLMAKGTRCVSTNKKSGWRLRLATFWHEIQRGFSSHQRIPLMVRYAYPLCAMDGRGISIRLHEELSDPHWSLRYPLDLVFVFTLV